MSAPSAAARRAVHAALDGAELTSAELDGPAFDDFVAALIEVLPIATERLAAAGIAQQVIDDTLADIGRKVGTYGDDGIRGWAIELLRGDVITLGRLQFERRVGEHGRHIHIPELGPLDPASVDDALARARAWFRDDAVYCCDSWLLDPRLAALGEGSNIVRFQRRFRLVDAAAHESPEDADRSVAKFVFRRAPDEVIALDPATMSSLQRLVAGVLGSGGHWTEPLGILIA